MSRPSTHRICHRQISLPEASPVKTSPSLPSIPREMACKVLAAASGRSWRELLKLRNQLGSWLKTWRMALAAGSPVFVQSWHDKVTQRYRSSLRRAGSGCPTFVGESSLLPTPTASRYGSSNNGCPHDGRDQYKQKGKRSLWSLAKIQGGDLNPAFSEWMMGFPENWTTPDSRR